MRFQIGGLGFYFGVFFTKYKNGNCENDENIGSTEIVECTRAPLIDFSDEDKKKIE